MHHGDRLIMFNKFYLSEFETSNLINCALQKTFNMNFYSNLISSFCSIDILQCLQKDRANYDRYINDFLSLFFFFSFFLSFHPLLLFSTPPFFPPFLIHGEKSGLVPGWDQLYHRLRCTPLMAVTHSRVAPVYTKLHSWPASVHNYQSPKHAVC